MRASTTQNMAKSDEKRSTSRRHIQTCPPLELPALVDPSDNVPSVTVSETSTESKRKWQSEPVVAASDATRTPQTQDESIAAPTPTAVTISENDCVISLQSSAPPESSSDADPTDSIAVSPLSIEYTLLWNSYVLITDRASVHRGAFEDCFHDNPKETVELMLLCAPWVSQCTTKVVVKNRLKKCYVYTDKRRSEGQLSRCERVKRALSYCGVLTVISGYIFCCPPTIGAITAKFAFHPPQCGYAFQGSDNTRISKLKRRHIKQRFRIVSRDPKSKIESTTNSHIIATALLTPRNNVIACIMFQPHHQQTDQVIIISLANSSELSTYVNLHGGCISQIELLCEFLGCRIVVYDYSGFGISSGTPSELNIYADIYTVYKAVTTNVWLGVRPNRVVLMGMSIGSAAVVNLAAQSEIDIGGVILVGAFTSGLDVHVKQPASEKEIQRRIIDPFNNINKIGHIRQPILLIHGAKDDVCPVSHYDALCGRIQNSFRPLRLNDAQHMDPFMFVEYYIHIRALMHHVNTDIQ